MNAWKIEPMLGKHDIEIARWRYEGEYAYYNAPENAALGVDPAAPVPEGWAVTDENGALVGFFYFGVSCRVPTQEDYRWEEGYLDIGLGLRPDLCGKGTGLSFLRFGMDFARAQLGAERFRLCVAQFNVRAARVYERAGFAKIAVVTNPYHAKAFYVMTTR